MIRSRIDTENMPSTPIHIGFNITIYYIVSLIFPGMEFLMINCLFLVGAELIDLDHLLSRPIYDPRRDSLKTHLFHRNWKIIIGLSMIALFFDHVRFAGLGLISHLGLDYIQARYFMG